MSDPVLCLRHRQRLLSIIATSYCLTLSEQEDNCSNNGHEVEWQVQEIVDDGLRRKLGEWALQQLPKPATRRLELAAVLDKGSLVLGHEDQVERIDQSIIDQEALAQGGDDNRALGEYERDGRDPGQRTIDKL